MPHCSTHGMAGRSTGFPLVKDVLLDILRVLEIYDYSFTFLHLVPIWTETHTLCCNICLLDSTSHFANTTWTWPQQQFHENTFPSQDQSFIFLNIIKIQMKKISGIPTGSKSLEQHIESGNLFCFVYLRPEEITDSSLLPLQITK